MSINKKNIDLADFFFNINHNYFTSYMKTFNISNSMLNESMEILEEWFRMEPHLPDIVLGHDYLLRLLCVSKFSIEKSKHRIENLFTARTVTPEFFSNVDPASDEIRNVLKTVQWIVTPKLNNNFERVTILRYTEEDSKFYSPADAFKYVCMTSTLRYKYETCFIEAVIIDCANIKLGHAFKHTPTIIKKILFVIENCLGYRVSGFHILNMPSHCISTLNLLKALMKGKLSRVHVHDSLEELHQLINKEVLPVEYGGEFYTCNDLSDKLQSLMERSDNRKLLIESQKHKSDESKRHGDTKGNFDKLLGMAGSFRKLDID